MCVCVCVLLEVVVCAQKSKLEGSQSIVLIVIWLTVLHTRIFAFSDQQFHTTHATENTSPE